MCDVCEFVKGRRWAQWVKKARVCMWEVLATAGDYGVGFVCGFM